MAGLQTAWEKARADLSAQQEAARAAAIAGGTGGEYYRFDAGRGGAPISTGYGSTSIAPKWLNPGGIPSHVISVGWEGTGGPGDPAFEPIMAAAAQRMTENFVYDPSVGGYTAQPGARARIAEAIREANG